VLETVADIVGIVGGLSLLAGVIFAVVQIRQLYEQRRDSAAIELMRAFQAPRFVEAFYKLGKVPAGLPARDLRAMGKEYEEAALTMVNIYETVGLLVFRRTVSFEAVRQVCGGILASSWTQLETWVGDVRVEEESKRFGEWFQWLVERVREQEAAAPSEPAQERYRTWRPRD